MEKNWPSSTKPGPGWKDEVCHTSLCVACTILANQFYKLRGLCKKTLYVFLGYLSYIICSIETLLLFSDLMQNTRLMEQ